MYTGEFGYSNFTGLCEVLTELLPKDADRSKLRALDLGCGTGIIAKQLRELLGFRLVDGVDGSPGMIAQAEKLGIICRGYVEIVENRSLTQVPHGVYDVVPNSLPFVGELLKPGGLLCTEIRRSVIEETDIGEIELEAKKMEASGGWKILKWRHESVYNLNVPGFIYVLQKLPGRPPAVRGWRPAVASNNPVTRRRTLIVTNGSLLKNAETDCSAEQPRFDVLRISVAMLLLRESRVADGIEQITIRFLQLMQLRDLFKNSDSEASQGESSPDQLKALETRLEEVSGLE
uniref:Methyltransf_25 domain-containing protein n=1 Tax=Macrostomum lignano TaxID=282301 RepID=A0A1I8F7A1_9PLAT